MKIKSLFDSPARKDLFEVGEKRLERLKAEGRYSCYRSTRATLRKLSQFTHGKPLPAGKVTPALMTDFREFLEKEKGNSHNTIVENIKLVMLLTGEAGIDTSLLAEAIPSRKQTLRSWLTEDELRRLMSLRLAEGCDMAVARDMFFVECRTGLRISDIIQLRWKDCAAGKIELRMQKTRKTISLPMSSCVAAVVERYRTLFSGPDDYVFPPMRNKTVEAEAFQNDKAVIYCTSRINLLLKKLAKLTGLDKNLSTHTGRHTFATMLLGKGATIFEVKELLGHGDIKVTQIYTHLLDDRKRELVQMLDSL